MKSTKVDDPTADTDHDDNDVGLEIKTREDIDWISDLDGACAEARQVKAAAIGKQWKTRRWITPLVEDLIMETPAMIIVTPVVEGLVIRAVKMAMVEEVWQLMVVDSDLELGIRTKIMERSILEDMEKERKVRLKKKMTKS